jgi:hypothetical protein
MEVEPRVHALFGEVNQYLFSHVRNKYYAPYRRSFRSWQSLSLISQHYFDIPTLSKAINRTIDKGIYGIFRCIEWGF